MSSTIPSASLLSEIKVDHDNIRDLFGCYTEAVGNNDEKLALDISNTIIREVSVHSDAEEVSLYKFMEEKGMDSIVEHDRGEHQQVKQAMYEIDHSSPDSVGGWPNYTAMLTRAVEQLMHHAEEEEGEQLPQLQSKMTPVEETRLINDFLKARRMAPTRPHPSAPQSGGMAQKAAAAASKPMDSAAHAFRGHVDLKYHHIDDSEAGA